MGVNVMRDKAGGRRAVAGFDFGSEVFETQLEDSRLRTTAVAKPEAPFVLSGSGNRLAMAVYGAAPLSHLVSGQIIGAEGDLAAAQEFVDLFRLEAQPWP